MYLIASPVPIKVKLLKNKNLNAVFIEDNLSQSKRLQKLNSIAISQMKVLTADNTVKALEN